MRLFRVTKWEPVGHNHEGIPTRFRPATLWQRFVFALQRNPLRHTPSGEMVHFPCHACGGNHESTTSVGYTWRDGGWQRADIDEPASLDEAKARMHELVNIT
jgi:hypothetical protein